jgi:hypothetical protein
MNKFYRIQMSTLWEGGEVRLEAEQWKGTTHIIT